ncbi:hypothetical protein JHK84_055558 [Glycine max]|nr:hypothetical protein JHK84_055558 [Glycine max]
MLAFAEKLGQRILKHNESVVQEFCAQTSVQPHVLKVWVHNNRHTPWVTIITTTIPSWKLNLEAREIMFLKF